MTFRIGSAKSPVRVRFRAAGKPEHWFDLGNGGYSLPHAEDSRLSADLPDDDSDGRGARTVRCRPGVHALRCIALPVQPGSALLSVHHPAILAPPNAMTALVKSLWASVQGDPVFMRRVNGWFTIAWLAMIPVSVVTHWIASVTYVAALSLWALVSGHWSAWQAARVEVNQEREARVRDAADVPGEVVERIVQKTEVELAATADG